MVENHSVQLQVIMLMYAEEVVLGNCPVPPARFKTLDDYEESEWDQWLAEEEPVEEEFVCLLPCRITLEETKAWMAQEPVPCDPYWLIPISL